ncbi:MAG: hypothetical protein HHJ19_17085 [Polaromonas sp.]|nr:hypothetical protein [Polaromonas sp.]
MRHGSVPDRCIQSRMKHNASVVVFLAYTALSSCALISSTSDPAARVTVGGEPFLISQLTESTWTASAAGIARPLPYNSANKTALLLAIEKISGCKVTDSDYSRQGMQFDAQVECGKPTEKAGTRIIR